ncbi:MAG: methylated-DNA--[protein]-cysteine S-methyltransferase [Sphingobacteriales bacterium]|nr:methylated-DNA--[protein]-cysteine S-methyltransferase [Sphingobacteriales bacterium]
MESNFHYQTVAKAINYIKDNYESQPTLDQVAEHVHLSKFHFQRTFKEWAGISPKEFLQFITAQHAKRALQKGLSTLETAYEVGLSGNSRLHDLFVKVEACTPGEFQLRGKGLKVFIDEFETPFGTAAIAETERGISNLIFGKLTELKTVKNLKEASFVTGLKENGQRVKEYLTEWKKPDTSIQLDLSGSSFQLQVWRALLEIPSSRLVTYQHIAEKIQRPKAVRAVGSAIGNNPVAYLIPCHRVIRASGDSGEYHWGKERKVVMHAFESAVLPSL